MSIIVYFWCLLGLYLCVFINLRHGFCSWSMNSEGVYTFNPLLCFSIDKREGIIAALRSSFGERIAEKQNSVIHFINSYIKLFYAYFANYVSTKFWSKNDPIVEN